MNKIVVLSRTIQFHVREDTIEEFGVRIEVIRRDLRNHDFGLKCLNPPFVIPALLFAIFVTLPWNKFGN